MPEMLKARGAVTGAAIPRGAHLVEVKSIGKIDLRGDPGDKAFMSAIGRSLDLLLPTEPCQTAAQGDVAALWLGPDQWLITCPSDRVAEFMEKLGDATRKGGGAVTDVSAGRSLFRLSGPNALDILAKGCPLDLHPNVVRPGFVAGSVLAKITVLIHLREEDGVDLYFGRSFADYLWAWLEEAGTDCGLTIA